MFLFCFYLTLKVFTFSITWRIISPTQQSLVYVKLKRYGMTAKKTKFHQRTNDEKRSSLEMVTLVNL